MDYQGESDRKVLLHYASTLSSDVEELSEKSKQAAERIEYLKAENHSLYQDLSEIKGSFQEKCLEVRMLKSEIEDLKGRCQELAQGQSDKNHEVVAIKGEFARESIALKTELHEAQQELVRIKQSEEQQRQICGEKCLKLEQKALFFSNNFNQLRQTTEDLKRKLVDFNTTLWDKIALNNEKESRIQEMEHINAELRLKMSENDGIWERKLCEIKRGVQKKHPILTSHRTADQEIEYLVEKLDALQGKYVESLHNEKTLKDQLKAFLSEYEAKLPVLKQQKTNYEELLIAYNSVKIELEDSQEVNRNLEETFKKSTIESESLRKERKDLQKTAALLSSQVKTLFNENFQLKNHESNSPSTGNLMNMQDLQYKYLELQASMEDIVNEKDSIIENCVKDKEILSSQLIETEQKLANSYQTTSNNKEKENLYILEHFYQQELQKISKTTEDKDKLLRENTVLAKTNKELETLYQAAKSELEMIREENKSLTGKYMKTEQEISHLIRNHSISQHNIIKQSEEVNTLKSIIQANEYSRKTSEETYENLHVSYLQLHESIKESDRRVVTLQEIHSAEISKFLQEKIRYHTEINKKQTELANNRQHWTEELAKLKEEVETYKLNQESFSDSAVLLSKTIEISSIKSELERETGNNSILLKKVKELQSYEHYKEQYEMTKEELSTISQDNEVLKTNNEIYKLTNQELSSDIQALRKNYIALEGKFLNAKTYSSEGQLSSLLQNIDSLSEQKIATDTLCETLIAEKSQLSQENQYLKTVLQNQPSAPPLLYQLVSLIHKSLSN